MQLLPRRSRHLIAPTIVSVIATASCGVLAAFVVAPGSPQAGRGGAGLRTATSEPVAALTRLTSTSPSTSSTSPSTSTLAQRLASLRLMNWYPADAAWENMWAPGWNPEQATGDFARIAGLGGNAVRIIIQPWAFGYPTPNPTLLARLHTLVSEAANAGLKVQLTLFDHWSDFSDVAGSTAWAQSVLAPYAGSSEIAFVELQNEVVPSNSTQIQWVRTMLPIVRRMLHGIPLTVSLPGLASSAPLSSLKAALGSSLPDFWDVHYYGPAGLAYSVFAAEQGVASPQPLFIGETGMSSITPSGALDNVTPAQDIATIEEATKLLGLPAAAPWMLNDLTSTAAPTTLPAAQYGFGLYTTSAVAKPAAAVVRSFFTSDTVTDELNGSFTMGTIANAPQGWLPWATPWSTVSVVPTVGYAGMASAALTGTGSSQYGIPSLYTTPVPQPWGSQQTFTLSAWALPKAATGQSDVTISWYGPTFQWIASTSSAPLDNAATGWTQLSVTGTAPPGTAYAEIFLRSQNNSGTVYFSDVQFAQ